MSFPSAAAGPSRLPYRAATGPSLRPLLSSRSYAKAAEEDEGRSTAPPPPVGGRGRRTQSLTFSSWRSTVAKEFKRPIEGQKAVWLGGNVPYPMNPTFRPPPPLGDNWQDLLYKEIRSGNKTLGEISAEFNVGKARLDAVRKLKEIEAEFIRQEIPLQMAFKEGMEPLLGVQPVSANRWSRTEERTPKVDNHESAQAEADEEKRFLDGIGAGGSFGDRNRVEAGFERMVFDWRGEDEMLDSKAAGLEESAYPTVETEKARRAAATKTTRSEKSELPERVVSSMSPTTAWRFVDVSSTGVAQHPQVLAAMEKRAKAAQKKKEYKLRKKGIYE